MQIEMSERSLHAAQRGSLPPAASVTTRIDPKTREKVAHLFYSGSLDDRKGKIVFFVVRATSVIVYLTIVATTAMLSFPLSSWQAWLSFALDVAATLYVSVEQQ